MATQTSTAWTADEVSNLSIHAIARIIQRDWSTKGKGVNFAAKPYLEVMRSMEDVDAKYGMDSGASIIRYFLSNAGSWRGETAKIVKAELNKRIKGKF